MKLPGLEVVNAKVLNVCLQTDLVSDGGLSISDDVTVTSLAVVPVTQFLNSSTILALCAGA